MASPFARFRKRQKVYLAFLGVLCMFAFVFGGVTCSSGPSQRSVDPVAASTKYGDLHESKLAAMQANLDLVNRFLSNIVVRSAEKTFQMSNFPPNLREQFLRFEISRLEQEGLISDESETAAVDALILAHKAEELGVVVSDEAIKEFIRQKTNDKLTRDELVAEVNRLNVSQKRLFDALRTQLMSVRVQNLFGRGLMAAPPAQQWEYYQRLNRRARAEIVPVAVAKFVSEVPDPPEETLRKFFEENKNRVARPGSAEPGFKQPHKVALQYLKAEFDKFNNEAAISDEEIQQHYEKNLKNYPYRDLPLETPEVKQESADEPATEKPADKPDGEAEDKPQEGDGCQSDEKQADAAAQSPATPNTPASDNVEKPAAQPTEPTPPPTATEPVAKQTEQGRSLLEITGDYALPRDIRGGPKPEHAPLWSVKERIRSELAGQQARKKMEEALNQVKPALDRYYNDFALWKSTHPDLKDDGTKPARPNFMDLAKQHGLSAHEVYLASIHHILTETDLGQAIAGRGAGFVVQALQSLPVFRHNAVQDTAGNQYLYWKWQDVPEHVPSFDDPEIRSEVLAVWKQIQARDLAMKRAEELAQTARSAKKPLADTFAEETSIKVTETIPFTWMTQGSEFLGPQEPRITTVPGVDAPGTDFMRTVFDLAEGEVGVAFNAPKTEIYVVRVTSVEPSPRVLMTKFLEENPRQQQTYYTLSHEENMEMSREWLKDVREAAGLHWRREAYSGAMR